MSVEPFSARARVAEPGEGITHDELQLAARNHGMPLEALRYDVTPPGLHYTLVHYDIPAADPGSWRLTVDGCVNRPLDLDLAAVRSGPRRSMRVTLECAGNGRARLMPRPISQPWLVEAVGTADWTGVPLRHLLDRAGVRADAVDAVFTGADSGVERGVRQDYARGLPIAEALADDVLIADEMNGEPLPPQHGFPLRLIVPGWYGMAHVKWLRSIRLIDHSYDGFQNDVAYRLRSEPDEPGTPVTRIEPRALLQPPGVPDFMSRIRFMKAGPVVLSGRAWSGWAPVDRVDVSVDSGTSWLPAEVESRQADWAWQRFTYNWNAEPGEHVLTARAFDTSGRAQPEQAPWNRGGFANNSVQRILVVAE